MKKFMKLGDDDKAIRLIFIAWCLRLGAEYVPMNQKLSKILVGTSIGIAIVSVGLTIKDIHEYWFGDRDEYWKRRLAL